MYLKCSKLLTFDNFNDFFFLDVLTKVEVLIQVNRVVASILWHRECELLWLGFLLLLHDAALLLVFSHAGRVDGEAQREEI